MYWAVEFRFSFGAPGFWGLRSWLVMVGKGDEFADVFKRILPRHLSNSLILVSFLSATVFFSTSLLHNICISIILT